MTSRMPAVFFGHGTPMNALDHNRFTEAWRTFGEAIPTPDAVLAISAHWYVDATAVTAMTTPPTIHDFYGFPPELFAVEYPAPGDPELAAQVADILGPTPVRLDLDTWGIDHGTWSVLVHAFPRADVPVVQLAIDATRPLQFHVDLGARLASLRDDGVLIVASGNVVHNLREVNWGAPEAGEPWAHRFDDEARRYMTTDPAAVGALEAHDDFHHAAPSPDHFIPLLYLAGLAGAAGEKAEVLVDGCAYGSLSMTSYTVGMAA